MKKLVVSPEAESDLIDIWMFIANDSPQNADRFLDRLLSVGERLSEFANMGLPRPELSPDLKSFPVERYVLYYRPRQQGIELLRVLHGSRDPFAQFDQDGHTR